MHYLICQTLTTEEEFASLSEEWAELFDHCSYPTPFCTWEWAWHWWQNLGAPDILAYQLIIVTVRDQDGQLQGIAPFYFPTLQGFPLRLRPLRLLGTSIRCRGTDITDEPILLLRAGEELSVLGALMAYLARQTDPGWDITHLRLMRRRESPGLAEAWDTVRADFPKTQTHLRSVDGQYVTLPETWTAFRHGLSKSMRDNLPYYPRLLTRHGHEWSIRTARTPLEVAAAAETLVALHHQRAESTLGTPHQDHLPTPMHSRCLRQALTALAASGRARIVLLEIGGVPIAAQAILEQYPLIQFHYSGFDPAWRAYSPITVLNAHVMQDAIERRVPLMDYLPKAEPWKARWGATSLYVLDELSCMALRPRPMLRLTRRSLVRHWQRRFGFTCDCGFCRLPLPETREPEERDMEKQGSGSVSPTIKMA